MKIQLWIVVDANGVSGVSDLELEEAMERYNEATNEVCGNVRTLRVELDVDFPAETLLTAKVPANPGRTAMEVS